MQARLTFLNSFCITQVKAGDDSAYNEFASFVVKP